MARNILVTGGGTGIGRAIAEAFAAGGDNVHITGRREEALTAAARDIAGSVHPIACDHTSPESLAGLLGQLPDHIDVLVNNAGGVAGPRFADDLTGIAAAWRWQLETNLMTAVLTTEALADRLAPGGSIVHIGSIAADKGAGAYGAAKAALASWNIDLARTLGARDVTSNVVAPGYVEATEFFGDTMTDTRRSTLIAATSANRPGRPEDIAGMVLYLASPGARYVTGQALNVNGGAWPTR